MTKIIQSFAIHNNYVPYLENVGDVENKQLLNFYTHLLSFLTLKKYYGSVTMYCNKNAYDMFIKYIPYDNVIIKECDVEDKLWSVYKVKVMTSLNEDIIHVDGDVFIFDSIFDKFINSNDIGALVQDTMPPVKNRWKFFPYANMKYLEKNNIITLDKYDDKFVSCGTFGIKKEYITGYKKVVDSLLNGYYKNELFFKNDFDIPIIVEELGLYLYMKNNDVMYDEIIPHEWVMELGSAEAGNRVKYTHMWGVSKFKITYIIMIKNKIKKEFPQYIECINEFEEKYKLNELLTLV